MAQRTSLAAVLNGLVRNVDLTADELVLDSVRLGGLAGTLLTKTILDGLISNSHASGSDNQNIVAGDALSGGGSGSTVTLDVNVDNTTIEINSDALRLKDAAVSATKLAASAITGQTEETSADNADMLLIYDNSATALRKMSRSNFLSGASDEKVKISSNDTTAGYIEDKLVVDVGTNASDALEASTLNDGGDEDYRIRFDQSKVDHGSIAGLSDDDHTQYILVDGTRAFTGDQSMGGNRLTSLAAPSSASDAATKGYVDNALEGLRPKEAVRVATTADIDLSTDLEDGDSIDGVTLATGDRVLVKDQAAPEDNGIYIVAASGAASRSADFDSLSPIDEINKAYVAVQEGSSHAGKLFVQYGTVAVLDTDPINFTFFNSVSGLTGGDGIAVSGSNISVDHDGEGLQFVANQLALELDGATLSKSASGLKVADGGIADAQVSASAAIAYSKLALSNSIVDADVNASAAIAYSKLNLSGSIVNADISASAAIAYSKLSLTNSIVDADINASAAIAYSKLNLNNSIVLNDLTSDSVDENKIKSSSHDASLSGGSGSVLSVVSAPANKKSMVAGEAFAADTSFLVRFALDGETAGRVYKADSANAVANGEFWAIGLAQGDDQSAGDPIMVTIIGTHILGASDTPFDPADIGKAVWLTDAGAFSITSPSDSGDASFRVGSVEDEDRVFIDGKQLTGIN